MRWFAGEDPPDELLVEASVLYAVCYQDAHAKNAAFGREEHSGLAFAWNVAGPYLMMIKAKARHARERPGMPMRLYCSSVLHRVVGASKARRIIHGEASDLDVDRVVEEESGGGGAEGGGDDDFISTPWER